jgi:hypothetical protein
VASGFFLGDAMTKAELDRKNALRYLAIRNGSVYFERDDDAGTIYVAGVDQPPKYCKTVDELDEYIDVELME